MCNYAVWKDLVDDGRFVTKSSTSMSRLVWVSVDVGDSTSRPGVLSYTCILGRFGRQVRSDRLTSQGLKRGCFWSIPKGEENKMQDFLN